MSTFNLFIWSEYTKRKALHVEFSLPSVIWAELAKKLDAKFVTCDGTFVHMDFM